MRVIPVGYGNAKHRELIPELMRDPRTLLIDTRYSKKAAIPGWHGTSLLRKYEDRYVYLGRVLGNRNYKTPEAGIEIVDLEGGLIDLYPFLQDGYTLLLLCGCGAYEKCHRKMIAEALVARYPNIEIVLPEQLMIAAQ